MPMLIGILIGAAAAALGWLWVTSKQQEEKIDAEQDPKAGASHEGSGERKVDPGDTPESR